MAIKIYELCGADDQLLFSPHCWKTRLCFAHKGLAWETEALPFTKVATIEDGDARRVPVIRDGDTVVEESFEIAKYLDEKYPTEHQLIPQGSAELTQFFINWSQTQLHSEVVKICLLDIYETLAPEDQAFFRSSREKLFGCTLEEFSQKFPKDNAGLTKALTPAALTLKKQTFIGGDKPIFADYVMFGALQWLNVVYPDDAIMPDGPVGVWFNRLLDMYDGLGRKAKTVRS